jgi:hypothetical protein
MRIGSKLCIWLGISESNGPYMFLQSTINESPWQVKNAAEAGQNSKQDHDDARSDSLYHVMLDVTKLCLLTIMSQRIIARKNCSLKSSSLHEKFLTFPHTPTLLVSRLSSNKPQQLAIYPEIPITIHQQLFDELRYFSCQRPFSH